MKNRSEKPRLIETTTLEKVPPEEKKSWVTVMLIQAGAQICIPSLMLGGLLVEGMPLINALLAGFVGYAIIAVLISIMGIVGSDLGVPTCVVSRGAFGVKGARVIVSTLYAVTLIGWFAVQNQVCGQSFTNLMNVFGIHFPVTASIILWGAIMLTTAVYGINALNTLNVVAIPALLIITGVGSYLALDIYGTASLFESNGAYSMTMLQGIGLTVSFSSFAVCTAPDFTRYQRTRKDTILSNAVGIGGSGYLMLVMGAVMSHLTGKYDISLVLVDIGIPVLGMLVLILATWTTNTTNSYCAGLNLVMMFNTKDQKRAVMTLIAGVVATAAAALNIISGLDLFINFLGYVFMPITGVIIADYWVLRRGNSDNWIVKSGWDWQGMVAAIVGMICTIYITVGLPAIQGMLISFALFLILRKFGNKSDRQFKRGED